MHVVLKPSTKRRKKDRASCKPVVLKVGRITPLGIILREKGVNKTKGATGRQNNTKGMKTLNH